MMCPPFWIFFPYLSILSNTNEVFAVPSLWRHLATGNGLDLGIACQVPDPVELLEVQPRDLCIVNDDHILIIAFFRIGGKIHGAGNHNPVVDHDYLVM